MLYAYWFVGLMLGLAAAIVMACCYEFGCDNKKKDSQ